MSDLEAPSTSHDVDRGARPEDVASLLGERPEREGLPRGYRMRADAHYVDQLDAGHDGYVIRVLETRHIEATNLSSSAASSALARSIAAHGILQPLLVRRRGGRYQLIAGRKRLAAALAAGLSEVPCVIHDADDSKTAALAEADNIREMSGEPSPPTADVDCVQEVLQALSGDLAGMASLITFLRPGIGGAFQHQATADLLQAQTWRAAWVAGAAAIVMNPYRAGRNKSVASILDRLKAGFDAEAQLSRVQLDFAVSVEAGQQTFDENLGHAVAGLIFATLSWLQDIDNARIEVRIDAPNARTLTCQIVQRSAVVPQATVKYLQGGNAARAGDAMATIGILTARTFAAQWGGVIELTPAGRRGSVLQASFRRPLED